MSDNILTPEILGSVSKPGDTLREYLVSREMTQVELADRTGLDKKTINLIVNGTAAVTQDTAIAFERIFEVPASFWLRLEANYQALEGAKKEEGRLKGYSSWASMFPLPAMVKAGWISCSLDQLGQTRALLDFFQVANPDSWKKVYVEKHFEASYRKTGAIAERLPIIAAWLRRGEILASSQNTGCEFNEEKFRKNLREIRKLTVLTDFSKIREGIQELCNDAGVKYAPTRELPSLGINGAMRWIGEYPVIQQSLRGKSHDAFWFTFFHEAWHVLQKQKRSLFLDADFLVGEDATREAEADAMAAEILIPKVQYMDFIARNAKKSRVAIEAFADSVGIHQGIVVGRLQRENRIPWNNGPLNKLKAKIDWD